MRDFLKPFMVLRSLTVFGRLFHNLGPEMLNVDWDIVRGHIILMWFVKTPMLVTDDKEKADCFNHHFTKASDLDDSKSEIPLFDLQITIP